MTTHNSPTDTNAVAMAAFKDEGAFLLSADCAADALKQRLAQSRPEAVVFVFSREEVTQMAEAFARSVAIAKEYHIGASDLAA